MPVCANSATPKACRLSEKTANRYPVLFQVAQGFGDAGIKIRHMADDPPVKCHIGIHHPLLISGEKRLQVLQKGYGISRCHVGRLRPRGAQRAGGLAQQLNMGVPAIPEREIPVEYDRFHSINQF